VTVKNTKQVIGFPTVCYRNISLIFQIHFPYFRFPGCYGDHELRGTYTVAEKWIGWSCMNCAMLWHQRLVCKIPLTSFTLRNSSEPINSGPCISNGSVREMWAVYKGISVFAANWVPPRESAFWFIFLVSIECLLLRSERNSNAQPSQNVWNVVCLYILDMKCAYHKNDFRLEASIMFLMPRFPIFLQVTCLESTPNIYSKFVAWLSLKHRYVTVKIWPCHGSGG
jgi:hypothetical protein